MSCIWDKLTGKKTKFLTKFVFLLVNLPRIVDYCDKDRGPANKN